VLIPTASSPRFVLPYFKFKEAMRGQIHLLSTRLPSQNLRTSSLILLNLPQMNVD
jgi:hypothetical protein